MRTRFAIALFAIVLLAQIQTQAQSPAWFQLTNGLPSTPRGDDNYFINQSTGWLARATDGIYKTTNGGNLWTKVTTGSSNHVTHFRSVSFATETHGWGGNLGAGSYDSTVTDTNNILYETFDGGGNWNSVSAISNSGMKGFCTFNILDSQHIYGAGRVRGPAYFVKSSDQGTNWTIVNLGTNGGLGIMGGIMDIYFHDTNNGFVVGMDTNAFNASCSPTYYGRIARTTDGGSTWTTVATTTNGCCYFWKMSWPSTNIGYASLQQNGSPMIGHVFYKTVDGGATWTPNVIPFSSIASGMTAFYWQGVGFVSTNEGWAGGSTTAISGSISNTFLHTTDGGATWSPVGFNDTQSINRFRILDPTLAYASGHKTYVYRIPVSITNQPQNQLVSTGANVTLTVGVAGNPPFTFQWQKNGTNVVGATDTTLALNDVALSDSGSYSVSATNTWDGLISSNALVTVYVPDTLPSISTQPQSQTVTQGSNATFSVTADGTAPLSYQWQREGTNLSVQTSSSYTLNNVQPSDAGNYGVVITNVVGSITSAVVVLTVNIPVNISTPPQSQTIVQGSSATISVTASGTAPLSYQWQRSGTNLNGQTTSSYTLNNVQTIDAGSYRVVVTNVVGAVTSAVAVLTVVLPPAITVQPQSQTVNLGATVTYNVTASGTSPLKYQWRFNDSDLAGATNSGYTNSNVQLTNSGSYTVVVTNNYGSVTSSVALLTVNPPYVAIFSDNFDTNSSANWTVNKSSTDTRITFNYDYSSNGIPSAPNSTGGTTKGVKFEANLSLGVTAALNMSPVSQSFTGNYRLRFDLWINVNGPFPGGGTGSTEHFTAGIGTAGNRVEWTGAGSTADGVWFAVDGDGGVSSGSTTFGDFCAFSGTTMQSTNSGVYQAGTNSTVRDNGNSFYLTVIPGGLSAPALQQSKYPQQTGALAAGTMGFAWHDVIVNKTNNTVEWSIDGLKIAMLTNATFTASNIFVGYWDGFASVSDNTNLSFGLLDNVRVEAQVLVPLITTQPKSQFFVQGSNATFSVTAIGTAPLGYQWRFNGTNLSGATGSSYTKTNVQTVDTGSYTVTITNSYGAVTSAVAFLHFQQLLKAPNFISTNMVSVMFGGVNGNPLTSNDIANFTVQFTSNLFDWITLTNPLTLTNGMMLFKDSSLYFQRYYRVVEP